MTLGEFTALAEAARLPASGLASWTQPATGLRRQDRTSPAGAGAPTLDEARKRLKEACARLADAPAGNADITLNGVLYDLGKLSRDTGLEKDEVLGVVLPAWLQRGKSYEDFCKVWPRAFNEGLNSTGAPRSGDEDDRYPVFERIVRFINDDEGTCEVYLQGFEKAVTITTKTMSRNNLFNEVCFTQLGVLFRERRRDAWADCVTEAMRTAEQRELPSDETPSGEFFNLLEEFCVSRHAGTDRESLLTGQPYDDEEAGLYVFRFSDFRRFLNTHISASFRGESLTKLGRRLAKIDGGRVETTTRFVKRKRIEVKCVRKCIFTPDPKLSIPAPPTDHV